MANSQKASAFHYTTSSIHSPKDLTGIKYSTILLQKYSQVSLLITDRDLRDNFLDLVASSSSFSSREATRIIEVFNSMLDVVNGFPTPKTISFVLDIWFLILLDKSHPCTETRIIQDALLLQKERMLYLILNTRNYPIYELHIRPLYSKFNKLTRSWNDTIVTTVQLRQSQIDFTMDDNRTEFNEKATRTFLHDESKSIESRRKLLAQLIVAGIIHNSNLEERYFFLQTFLSLLPELEDGHNLFRGPQYQCYTRVLRFFRPPPEVDFKTHMDRILSIFDNLDDPNPKRFLNLISLIMSALQAISPNNVLNTWKYKSDLIAQHFAGPEVTLSSGDLTEAMCALCTLRLFRESLELYTKHPELHNEEQIDVILRICEESKDWKLLQAQFEDMYGRGQLPYVSHYAIVMNALASIGARKEVDRLYAQLNRRRLEPNAAIFLALMNSRLHDNDVAGARQFFDEYVALVDSKRIDGAKTPYLFQQFFKAQSQISEVDDVMKQLRRALEEQRETGKVLLNASTLSRLAAYTADSLGLNELEEIRTVAMNLAIDDLEFLLALAQAYCRVDQFERAEKVIYEAHAASPIPFASARVYALQLALYRRWRDLLPSSKSRNQMLSRLGFVMSIVKLGSGKILRFDTDPNILVEVIRYNLSIGHNSAAYEAFGIAKRSEVLRESHFLPFLAHYLHLGTIEACSQIIKMYRRMADERVEGSARSYRYLMNALLKLDGRANHDLDNAFKLLQSIFDMHGLSLRGSKTSSKPLAVELSRNSPALGDIVANYVAHSRNSSVNIDILVSFLQQARSVMGEKLPHEFRIMIYRHLPRIYYQEGQIELAEALLASGIKDLHAIADRYIATWPYRDREITQIPRILDSVYRTMIKTKMSCLQATRREHEFVFLLRELYSRKLRLRGEQYNELIEGILALDKLSSEERRECVPFILGVCEDYLIAGNWVEVKARTRLKHMYETAMLVLCRHNPTVFSKYRILNEYYSVYSLESIEKKSGHVRLPMWRFIEQYQQNRKLLKLNQIKPVTILKNMPLLFSPPHLASTPNRLHAYNTTPLWHLVMEYCGDSETAMFELMDEYPGTIEYLLYNKAYRASMRQFRRNIDATVPPPVSKYEESAVQFRRRALEAMRDLMDESEFSAI